MSDVTACYQLRRRKRRSTLLRATTGGRVSRSVAHRPKETVHRKAASLFKHAVAEADVRVFRFPSGKVVAQLSLIPFPRRSGVRKLPERSDRSFDRALPRRDITVPAGQPKILAISW